MLCRELAGVLAGRLPVSMQPLRNLLAWLGTEEVSGFKLIEALGAIELLAGDDLTLGSLGNMNQTTAGDLIQVVGQLRQDVAGELQHVEAPRSWMETEGMNIFRLLLQLMNVVEQLATASHTHGSGQPQATTAGP
ncbi:hypothetical protein [Aeromonas bestiarum]|uniref:hypothetical protein n=1 Tax=Aeromonas bestiarum TaxID=105751 RepID=UPI001FD3405C|nr:hypothetical protein [Aeromonas bestiarum]